MTTTANIVPTAPTDGLPYCTTVALTGTEVDLGTPVPVLWGEAVIATVKLSITNYVSGTSTYIITQTDLGDGNWVDLAWVVWAGASNTSEVFLLSAGGVGAMNNAVDQSRAVGTAPASTGSIVCPLGGRIRFVGKTALSATVTATITYKIQPPR